MAATPPFKFHDAVVASLPPEYATALAAIGAPALLDAVLAFALGAPCPPDAAPETQSQWGAAQAERARLLPALNGVNGSASAKRIRDADGDAEPDTKKARLSGSSSPAPAPAQDHAEDPPLFTLHALSATAPVRKKVDITIHAHSIRLAHPATGAPEARVALAALTRAFVLPTRGKARAHWTVVLLGADAPAAAGAQGKAAQTAAAQAHAQHQIIFGVDAAAPAGFDVSKYVRAFAGEPPPISFRTMVKKGAPTLEHLHTFLRHLPARMQPVLAPRASVFRSALAKGAPAAGSARRAGKDGAHANGSADADGGVNDNSAAEEPEDGGAAGIDAYRGAKAGTLWFFPEGLLWGESKPCEFWAAEDLLGGGEGVRVGVSTGRSCSLWVRRRVPGAAQADGEGGAGEDGEEEEEAVETEFGMIDAREQEAIVRWVRRFGGAFGRPDAGAESDAGAGLAEGSKDKGKGKARAEADVDVVMGGSGAGGTTAHGGALWADNDEDDADFDGSESDEDSGGADSESSGGDGGGGGDEEEAEGSADDEDADGSGSDDVEELDPAHHPLLRPGAVPKRMSKAVIDMVVGMVEDDLVGGRAPVLGPESEDGDDDAGGAELEEDELEE